jgi:hypothetical protein
MRDVYCDECIHSHKTEKEKPCCICYDKSMFVLRDEIENKKELDE